MGHKHLNIKVTEFDQAALAEHAATEGKQLRVSLALFGTLAGGILILNSILVNLPLFSWLYGTSARELSEMMAMVGAVLLGLPIVVHAIEGVLHGHMHMDELVALAVIAAFAVGQYVEARTVAFIMLLA